MPFEVTALEAVVADLEATRLASEHEQAAKLQCAADKAERLDAAPIPRNALRESGNHELNGDRGERDVSFEE